MQRIIGERIQYARKQKNLTQADLADKLGIALSHMSNIECGKSNFSVDILIALLSELEISADWLLMPDNRYGKVNAAKELEALLEQCTREERIAVLSIVNAAVTGFTAIHKNQAQ